MARAKLTWMQVNPQVLIDIDRQRASALGITATQIENTLYNAYGQRQVSTIYTPSNEYWVILELDPKADSLNGPLNVTEDKSDGSEIFAVRRVPSGAISAIFFACVAEIGAEKFSVIGVSGMHPAFGFSRSHWSVASKTLRTLKLMV